MPSHFQSTECLCLCLVQVLVEELPTLAGMFGWPAPDGGLEPPLMTTNRQHLVVS